MASDLGGATSKYVRIDKVHQALKIFPTDTKLFDRFIIGLWACIGKRRHQYATISIYLMLEMHQILEARWTSTVESRDTLETRCVEETGSSFVLTYCDNSGEVETQKNVLIYLKKQILSTNESQENSNGENLLPPHVSLPLQGVFKTILQEIQKRMIDIEW